MITTLILTKNHINDIGKTLDSVKDIGPVLVADLGGTDGTVDFCRSVGAKVYSVKFDNDYSSIKNLLAKKAETDFLFWLEPGEEIVSGFEYFDSLKDDMYRVMMIEGDLLVKQPRIYRKGKATFSRPVFEGVEDKAKTTLPIVIGGASHPDLRAIADCLSLWQNREALNSDIDYYQSCHHLLTKQYERFLASAEKYLFQNKTLDDNTVLTRYYMATLLKKRDANKSLKLILECISARPLMAEFWCLLGDLYLSEFKQLDRAYVFYENALLLGGRRLEEDTMPMEISKYDEYPRRMMEGVGLAIKKIVNKPSLSD
jgi:tetratricopeptide (TPR) repeat protein